MGYFDSLLGSLSTDVSRTIDRWLSMDSATDPVPVFVRYVNHNIAPVISVFIQAPWGFYFQGHKFSVGGSKK